ncbi:MAG: rRNA maturation RNase YbeY [Actinomycetaceae bacterium]|nr:rRNA maturation RNase YbeY [Actinomycetaceae bacterium]MDY6142928.1 rRNA maturation RNase YbeY [Arcanobacterium sp.]
MIDVSDESGYTPSPDLREVEELARWVLGEMRIHPEADLSIMMIDESTMADLHVRWLDLEGPTDVMSFPMDELRPAPPGVEPEEGLLGDIVLCPSVAARQAQDAGHAMMEEILLLVTHGILHLLGYDHAEEDERKEMFDLQRKLLLTFLARKPQNPNVPEVDALSIDDVAPQLVDQTQGDAAQ